MKPVSILHYVEKSFEGKPSFVILMSDSKEYISNGYVFIENTESNRKHLVEEYDCADFLSDLFSSPPMPNDELTNASFMYGGCTSLTTPGDHPLVTDARWMYDGCTFIQSGGA